MELGSSLMDKQAASAAKHQDARVLIRLESESCADPNRIEEIIRIFTIFTGLVRGVTDFHVLLFQWLHPIIKDMIPAIVRTYLLYPIVLKSIIKFLYRTAQSSLRVLPSSYVPDLLLSIRTVTKSFVDFYDISSGEMANSETDEEVLKNIGQIFRSESYPFPSAEVFELYLRFLEWSESGMI